jgi:hypothetical protein
LNIKQTIVIITNNVNIVDIIATAPAFAFESLGLLVGLGVGVDFLAILFSKSFRLKIYKYNPAT